MSDMKPPEFSTSSAELSRHRREIDSLKSEATSVTKPGQRAAYIEEKRIHELYKAFDSQRM